jgi:hypothetical protein
VKRLTVSIIGGLLVPLIGYLDIELNWGLRWDTFPGNILTLLMTPGYFCAALLLPQQAKSESAGLILFLVAAVFTFVIYSSAIYTALWLIAKLKKR